MTEQLATVDAEQTQLDAPSTSTRPLWRRLASRPLVVGSVIVLAILAVLVVAGAALAPYDPAAPSIDARLEPPSGEHWLGTDAFGRDMLSRLMAGARLSVGSGMFSLAVALVVGVGAGLVAGYRGGWFDTLATWVVSLFMAVPSIIVLAAARSAFGPSLFAMMLLLGLFLAPVYYRIVYGSVRAVRNELYVDAARVAGLSDLRIVGRHVLTAVRAPVIVQTSMLAGMSVTLLAGLEFLGLGDPDSPTWGTLLASGFQQVYTASWLVTAPAVMLSLTGMAFVLLGNGLRDELQGTATPRRPRPRRRQRGATTDSAEHAHPAAPPIVHPGESTPSADSQDVLSVRDLRVGFDQAGGTHVEIVHGVSLDVRRGEVHGLIGESGSGKTQTVLAVLGLLSGGGRITSGEIRLDGERVDPDDDRSYTRVRGQRIGYIPQEPMTNLDPSFTVGSQLTYPLVKVLGLSKRDAQARGLGLLERVGIPDPARTFASYPFELSGGMVQRVLIAGAISLEPDVLIADEPTTALDVTVQAEVLDLLRDLQRERQMSLLLVTHNVGVVADLCDRVTVMYDGRFVERGPVRDVLQSPQDPYTAALFDALLDDRPPRPPLPVEAEQ